MTTATTPSNDLALRDEPQQMMPVSSDIGGDLSGYVDRAIYKQLCNVANVLSKSDLVPQQYRGAPANCFIACQLAYRWQMDPFMVMQSTYIVHGKPGLESKLIIALINASGKFEDPLDFEFEGKPGTDSRAVTVSAKRAKTGKLCSMRFQYATAVAEGWVGKAGSKWKTMEDQMMMYRGATFFARVYCPEVILGLQTRDELDDIGPVGVSALPEGRSSFRPELASGAPKNGVIDTTASEATDPPQSIGNDVAAASEKIKAAQDAAKAKQEPEVKLEKLPQATWDNLAKAANEATELEGAELTALVISFLNSIGFSRADLNDKEKRKAVLLAELTADQWRELATMKHSGGPQGR